MCPFLLAGSAIRHTALEITVLHRSHASPLSFLQWCPSIPLVLPPVNARSRHLASGSTFVWPEVQLLTDAGWGIA
jgi:hypothetical protein